MSVVVPSALNIEVTYPSGKTKTVNMLRMLVQTQNAEFKMKTGMFLPGVSKQHPTVAALREEYEIPINVCRTWSQAAACMRSFYNELQQALNQCEATNEEG